MTHYLLASAITIFLLYVAYCDVTEKHTSPVWMGMLITTVAVWRLSRQELAFLAFWAGIILCWRLRFYQSGDAQTLFFLFALWPDGWLLITICAVIFLVIGSILWWRYRGRWSYLWYWWRARLRAGVWRPSPAELRMGEPITFLFSAVGIACAWFGGGL